MDIDWDATRMVTEDQVDRYVELADESRSGLYGPDSAVWMDRLDQEVDQLRVVLRWLTERQRREDVDRALRLAGGLRDYWWKRGYLEEGRGWLVRLLALPEASAWTEVRATALDDAAVLAFYQGDYEAASSLLRESIAIWRDLGEPEYVVYSLLHLATVCRVGKGDTAAAKAANEEALAAAQQGRFERGIAYALSALGRVAIDEEEWSLARSRLAESMRLLWTLRDSWAMALVLRHFALLAAGTNAPRRALRLAGVATALQEGLGVPSVPADQEKTEAALAKARAALSSDDADAAWKEGTAMTLERAVEYALQADDGSDSAL